MQGIPGFRRDEPALVTEGSGPPILLIPGLLSPQSIWSAVAAVLGARFRLIASDLQTHLPPGRRSVADRAQAWRDLMDELELPSAHVVAHGSGCQVAAVLALESPYRTLSLSLVNPVLPRSESGPGLQYSWHLNMLTQWLETRHGRVVRQPEHLQLLQKVLSEQTLTRFAEPAAPVAYGVPQLDDCDLAGLADLDFPVLAINGSAEPEEVCQLTQTMYARAPHFRYRQIPGVRQNCLRESPGLLANLLAEFLEDVENPVTLL